MFFFAVYLLCLAPAYLKCKSYKISFFPTSNADETLNINLTNYSLEFLTHNWVLIFMKRTGLFFQYSSEFELFQTLLVDESIYVPGPWHMLFWDCREIVAASKFSAIEVSAVNFSLC